MNTRILPTEIHSCFNCNHLDFHVSYPDRNYYNMLCNHPKGGVGWKDKCPDRDSRPYGDIPNWCPLQPIKKEELKETHRKRLIMVEE